MTDWPPSVPTSSTSSCSAAAMVPPGWTTPSTRPSDTRWSPVRPTHAGPINHVLPAWDVCCGLYAALAVVAAVLPPRPDRDGCAHQPRARRRRAGHGGQSGIADRAAGERDRNGERLGNAIYGQYGQDFTSRDGVTFMVVTLTGRHFRDLVEVTGTPARRCRRSPRRWAWTSAPKATATGTATCSPVCSRPGSPSTRPSEITDALSDTTVLFERYRTFAEVAEDDRVTAQSAVLPAAPTGRRRIFRARACRPHSTAPIRPARPRRPWDKTPPTLLAEYLGLTAADIARLTSAKTIA